MFVFFFYHLLVSFCQGFIGPSVARLHLIIYMSSCLSLFFHHPLSQHTTGHIYGCKVTNKFPVKYENTTEMTRNKNPLVHLYSPCSQPVRRIGGGG